MFWLCLTWVHCCSERCRYAQNCPLRAAVTLEGALSPWAPLNWPCSCCYNGKAAHKAWKETLINTPQRTSACYYGSLLLLEGLYCLHRLIRAAGRRWIEGSTSASLHYSTVELQINLAGHKYCGSREPRIYQKICVQAIKVLPFKSENCHCWWRNTVPDPSKS